MWDSINFEEESQEIEEMGKIEILRVLIVEKYKYLGIHMDSFLNLQYHYEHLENVI